MSNDKPTQTAIQATPAKAAPGNPGTPDTVGKRLASRYLAEALRPGTPTALTTVYTRNLVINIYQMLLEAARRRETLTYEMIAIANGLPASGSQLGQVVAPLLGRIYAYSESRGLPHITVLVVRKSGAEKGVPGAGFWKLLVDGQASVARHTVVDGALVETLDELTIAGKRQITANLQAAVFDFYSLQDI